MEDGLRMVKAGACSAWPLPGDPTCAGIARRMFRCVAHGLALVPAVIDDGELMVSELAANTLHAHYGQPAKAGPELWLYLRGAGERRELVCKVFDAFPGWLRASGPVRDARRAPADAVNGRGLEVVHELSGGRWGHHLTRARLAGWGVRGKAVWFAVPLAGTANAAAAPMSAADAMAELEGGLTARGLDGEKVLRADDAGADLAVLSVGHGLTVWCRDGAAWLRAPGLASQEWTYCDLVEVAEQAVQAYEAQAGG
jgi:hypothetical protein